MQYGQLITRSLSLVWRHKYLWLLAILGGADVGTGGFGGSFGNPGSFGGGAPSQGGGGAGPAGPALGDASQQVSRFLQDWIGVIAIAGIVLLVLVLAWFALSSITIGALVRASAEHDADRPFGLGVAWRTGVGTFWSIVGLRLLSLLWGLLVVAVLGLFVALGIVSYVNGQQGALTAVVTIGILVGLVVILASIAVGLAFILATRAVVLEQRGPVAALGRGLGLLRARLGRVLLVWLIQVGLGLAAAVAIIVVFVPVILLGVAVAVGAGVTGGPGAAALAAIPLGLLGLVLAVLAGGLVGAYLSTYWTLAFRRLELEAPSPVAWPPAAYPPRPTA